MTQIRRSYNCASPLLLLLLTQLLLLCVLNSCNGASTGTTPKTTQTTQNKQDPVCLLPLEVGPCRMSLERYYFNAQTNSCEKFKFGGCRGNGNRFGFRITCENACLRPITTAGSAISATTLNPLVGVPTLRAVAATTQSPKMVLVTRE